MSKLDYLKDLGVDVVSLSPIYPEDSNDVEFSITNHTSVDTDYGDIQDLIDLISAVHKRGIFLMYKLNTLNWKSTELNRFDVLLL